MKKIISVLLVCAMLLSFGVVVSANGTDGTAITVNKVNRLSPTDLDGLEGTGVYTGVIAANANTNTTEGQTGYLKLAHDGSYLYLLAHVENFDYANRTKVEMHVYVDFGEGTEYQMIGAVNQSPYYVGTTSNTQNAYEIGAASRYDTNYSYYYRFAVYNAENTNLGDDALDYGIFVARDRVISNTDGSTTNEYGTYEIVVPMPKTVKAALKNGDVQISAGFTYMLNGNNNNYVTSGEETTVSSGYRTWAQNGGTNAAQPVILTGANNTTTAVVNTNVVGVQTTTPVDNTYSARFLATLNTSDLGAEHIGFKFTGDKTVYQGCETVYSSVLADSKTVPAWYLGGDYIFAIDLADIEVGKTYTVTVSSYYVDGNDFKTSDEYTVTITSTSATDIKVTFG